MSIFFEIHADDVQRAVNFYQSIFGWRFTRNLNAPIEYWDIETGRSRAGLLKRPVETPPIGQGVNAFVCSMEVKNFDVVAGKIVANGGKISLKKFPAPGRCWQGYFIDTEGNTFGIFEVDEKAGI